MLAILPPLRPLKPLTQCEIIMADYKIPDTLESRLADVGSKHDLGTAEAVATYFLTRGLKAYNAPEGSLSSQIAYLVDKQGYSSVDEAVEHLLVRGLHEYEESDSTREES